MSRNLSKHNDYLKAQRISNLRLSKNEDFPDDTLENFSVNIIRKLHGNESYMKNLSTLKPSLESTDA